MDPREDMLAILAPYFSAEPDKTRERIILAARTRFLADGFARVTVEDLCHGLRVSKKTFYKHFRDKEDLVYAVIALNMQEIVPAVTAALADDAPPRRRLDRMMDTALNVVARRVSTVFIADLQAVIPELWEAIDRFRKEFIVPQIAQLVERAQADGSVRPDIDARVFSRFLYLILTRIADPRVLYEHEIPIDALFRTVFAVFQHGLGGPAKEDQS